MAACDINPQSTNKEKILSILRCSSFFNKPFTKITNGLILEHLKNAIQNVNITEFNEVLFETRSIIGSTPLRTSIINEFKTSHRSDADKIIDNSFLTSLIGRGGKKSRKYIKKSRKTNRRRNKTKAR